MDEVTEHQAQEAMRDLVVVSSECRAWMLERVSRTSNTLTEWCNARIEQGLPCFPEGRWYD